MILQSPIFGRSFKGNGLLKVTLAYPKPENSVINNGNPLPCFNPEFSKYTCLLNHASLYFGRRPIVTSRTLIL